MEATKYYVRQTVTPDTSLLIAQMFCNWQCSVVIMQFLHLFSDDLMLSAVTVLSNCETSVTKTNKEHILSIHDSIPLCHCMNSINTTIRNNHFADNKTLFWHLNMFYSEWLSPEGLTLQHKTKLLVLHHTVIAPLL